MQNAAVLLITSAALFLTARPPVVAADNPSLNAVQGKWVAKKTNADGQAITQSIEIAGDKLAFTLAGSDGEVRLFARGSLKTDMLGPFKVFMISGIEAGASATDTQPVGDDRVTLYTLRGEQLSLAGNFDKDRQDQPPGVDTYTRVPAPKKPSPPAEDEAAKLAGVWKLDVTLADNTRDYELRLARTDGKLGGSIISPRSGETKLKSITYLGNKLEMEMVRDIQGTEATILYTGKMEGGKLLGTVTVKGFEDQFTGTWTARK